MQNVETSNVATNEVSTQKEEKGMKKLFKTTFHNTVENLDTVIFSGGKIGYQVELNPNDLKKVVSYNTGDVIV